MDPGAPHLTRRAIRTAVHDHPGLRGILGRRLDPGAVTGLLLTVAVGLTVGAFVATGIVLAVVGLRQRPSWSLPAFLAVSIGGQFALVAVIKALIERARPDLAQLTGFAGASFPSGRAAAAATVWAVAALVLTRGAGRRYATALPGIAVGIAVAVAATRVMLGVHWFTDVVAGLAVGWGWFALCSIAFGGRVLHFGEPVEIAGEAAARTPSPPP